MANFFKQKIGQALRQSNFQKQKGFPCKDLLQFLVLLVFTGKNLRRYLDSDAGTALFQKDAVYRFLNDCHYNWRRRISQAGAAASNMRGFKICRPSSHRSDKHSGQSLCPPPA